MYDLVELREATDALWQAMARAFRDEGVRDVPDDLVRERGAEEIWSDPDLLFAQTCGYPLMHGLRGRVEVVATPCYSAPGCEASAYRSLITVPARSRAASLSDLRGATCAINQWTSHSGMNALRGELASLGATGRFFGGVIVTGSHLASMEALAREEADVASIDCVTHALLCRVRPELVKATRVIGQTKAAPAPPFITGRRGEVALLRRGLERVARVARETLGALLIEGFEILPESSYERILENRLAL
jgi:hypothetical protein